MEGRKLILDPGLGPARGAAALSQEHQSGAQALRLPVVEVEGKCQNLDPVQLLSNAMHSNSSRLGKRQSPAFQTLKSPTWSKKSTFQKSIFGHFFNFFVRIRPIFSNP